MKRRRLAICRLLAWSVVFACEAVPGAEFILEPSVPADRVRVAQGGAEHPVVPADQPVAPPTRQWNVPPPPAYYGMPPSDYYPPPTRFSTAPVETGALLAERDYLRAELEASRIDLYRAREDLRYTYAMLQEARGMLAMVSPLSGAAARDSAAERMAVMTARLQAVRAENITLKERFAGVVRDLAESRALIAALQADGPAVSAAVDAEQAQAMVAELRTELAAARSAMAETNEQIAAGRTRVSALESGIAGLQAELAERGEALSAAQARVSACESRLDRLNQSLDAAAGKDTANRAATMAAKTETGDAPPQPAPVAAMQREVAAAGVDAALAADGDASCPDGAANAGECDDGAEPGLSGIRFRYDSHELASPSFAMLDRVADVLRRRTGQRYEIAGHTDAQGDPLYNDWLSLQRARAVRRYLIERGVAPAMLVARGYGARRPVADNDTLEGLRRNRRVELRRLP